MTRRYAFATAGLPALLLLTACAGARPAADAGLPAERLRVDVVRTLPHDQGAFTQGLEISDGELLESTGRSGESWVRASSLDSGVERTRVDLPEPLFGEGITVYGDTVWQLTWKDGVAVARDRVTLTERERIRYDGQGLGPVRAARSAGDERRIVNPHLPGSGHVRAGRHDHGDAGRACAEQSQRARMHR